MPRPSKGARLYLDQSIGRFCIRHGTVKRNLPYGPDQQADAELALSDYVAGNVKPAVALIYFITAEHDGYPVKIGVSKDRLTRLAGLQVACPYRLLVAGVISDEVILERRLHRKFAHLRLLGEWFERTPELVDYLSRLCEERGVSFALSASLPDWPPTETT